MADPFHHSLSSVKKWGGKVEDYLPIHNWFDSTKAHVPGPQHRAMRHHSEGIALMISIFGPAIKNSDGRDVPTRWIGEQHVLEDFGFIPTMYDFMKHLQVQPWMIKGARRLSVELDKVEVK